MQESQFMVAIKMLTAKSLSVLVSLLNSRYHNLIILVLVVAYQWCICQEMLKHSPTHQTTSLSRYILTVAFYI